ncbi:MAG: hypothetical protein JO306_09075 [Gemmatimonadetes bacterium]|nr:hypothetical protein [Gemmatimonadota bacterium]
MKPLVPFCVAAAALFIASRNASAQTQPAEGATAPTAASASPADLTAAASRVHRRSDVLTTEEIDDSHEPTAYDVVRRLRPQWMHNRGGAVPDADGSYQVMVFYNGQPVGDIDVLKEYRVADVGTMRFVDPVRARATYGPGNGRGVITLTGRTH